MAQSQPVPNQPLPSMYQPREPKPFSFPSPGLAPRPPHQLPGLVEKPPAPFAHLKLAVKPLGAAPRSLASFHQGAALPKVSLKPPSLPGSRTSSLASAPKPPGLSLPKPLAEPHLPKLPVPVGPREPGRGMKRIKYR